MQIFWHLKQHENYCFIFDDQQSIRHRHEEVQVCLIFASSDDKYLKSCGNVKYLDQTLMSLISQSQLKITHRGLSDDY